MQRRRWVYAGILTGLLVGWLGVSGAAAASPLVSTEELATLLTNPDVKVVDARSPEDYAAGHIPGALSLFVRKVQFVERGVPDILVPVEQAESLLGSLGISPAHTVIVYDDTIWEPAARVFWTLETLGHQKVMVLNGGMSKWVKEGRPVSKDAPSVASAKYTANPDWSRYADAAYIMARLKDPMVALVDHRDQRQWSGQVASRQVRRAGRIPGGVLVDPELLIGSKDGVKVLKDEAEIAKLYTDAGATKEKEVISYCRTGMRASVGYLALRLVDYPKIRMYDGSMIEWGNRPELPIEK
jgi:thiosulfate/3-mercaptopyruvate sulfurtransferase